ncbi:MAG: protein kinase, partial [Planctomycetota bacterium]
EPKIGDFGLAKDLSQKNQKLTQSGEIMGTPVYMSPEQALSEKDLDQRTDIYSMGACLYEVLTEQPPFHSETLHELFYKIISEDPISPSRLNPKIHRDLDTIVLKALEKERNNRYRTMKDFSEDIERFLQGFPILAHPIGPLQKAFKWGKRNRQLIYVALFVFAGCLLFFAFHYGHKYQTYHATLNLYLKKANSAQNLASKIEPLSKKDRTKKIEYLLNALNNFNASLTLNLNNRELEDSKVKLVDELVKIVCENEEYELADYVARNLEPVRSISEEKKQVCVKYVQDQREQASKKHHQQFDLWIDRLRSSVLEPGEKDDAIFEISKMPEDEIFQKMLQMVEKGTNYFIQNKNRQSKQDEFYHII